MNENVVELVDREVFEAMCRMEPLLVSMCKRLVATDFKRTDFVEALFILGASQFTIGTLDGVYGHLERWTKKLKGEKDVGK